MLSLHNVSINYYTCIFFQNFIKMFFFFFFIILIINSFYSLSNKNLYNTKFFYVTYINFFLINFFLIFFVLKIFFLSFKLNNFLFHKQTYNTFFIFSDSLIVLSIVITLISWVYLSERYLNKFNFSVNYFVIFIFCTVNMVYSSNLLTMFIYFELIFLPSLFFVYKLGYSKKVEKTISYLLIWTLTGSLLILFSCVYLYSITNSLNLNYLITFNFNFEERFTLSILFFLGFGVKIPLWPFHYWLTKVHVEAPTGFSIFLSGFLVKTAFFCFSIVYIIFFNFTSSLIMLPIILWGCIDSSIRMWSASDIKRLIAFATIQEMNLILVFFLLTGSSRCKFISVFLILHGILSAFLFYIVDLIQKNFHSRNITSLSGLSIVSGQLHFFIWVGILIFRGFPVFSKFIIEWEILSSFLTNFGFFGFLVFFLISFFGTIGFCRVWFNLLYGQPSNNVLNSMSILKKDYYLGYVLLSIIIFLNSYLLIL
jgi:NADH-quinone oxidoreductase subunit M